MTKKLDIKKVLSAIDFNDREFYNKLDKEEKKEFSPWLTMRFASSSQNQPEHALLMTNDIVNVRFNELKKHPELQWKLLSIVGIGRRDFHPFIHPPKKEKKNKLQEEISKLRPGMKTDEIELFLLVNSREEILQYFQDLGYQDKEIKELFDD